MPLPTSASKNFHDHGVSTSHKVLVTQSAIPYFFSLPQHYESPALPVKVSGFSILSHNVSSLSLPVPYKYQNLLAACNKTDIDIICLVEINANTHHRKVRDSFYEIPRLIWTHSKTIATSTPDSSKSACQYGGTATIISNKSVHRVSHSGKDPLGRWSWTSLHSKGLPIKIYNCYMPCQQSLSASGEFTYSKQLWRVHRKSSTSSYDPRKASWADLKDEIQQDTTTHAILVCMDANSNANSTTSDISKLKLECGLIDFMSQCEQSSANESTYKRGKSRIDVIHYLI